MNAITKMKLLPVLLAVSCGGSPPPPPAAPLAAAPAAAAPAVDDSFRNQKPAPLAKAPSFDPPVAVARKLASGVPVYIRENHAVPLVVVEVDVASAIDAEPADKAGLADFTAEMMTEGTKSRSALDLAGALENLAATLNVRAGFSATSFHLNCLAETLPAALDVLADVVENPAFRKADVERRRGQHLTKLEQKVGSPGELAFDQLLRTFYGPKHPYGHPIGGTIASVKGITPRDLAAFHDAWFHPDNAFIVVSGDITPDAAVALLDQKLAGWKGKARPRALLPALPTLAGRGLHVIDRPDQSQSTVLMAMPLFGAGDPDAITMEVANNTLGGLFTSRLNMNLREDKAYSYGVFSFLWLRKDGGALEARGGIIAKNTVEAVTEMKKEIDRFASGELTDAELQQGKEAAVRSLPSELETNDAVAMAIAGLVLRGLPLDYFATLPGKVAAVTGADVKRAVTRMFAQAPWQTIIVGPVGPMEPALGGLGAGKLDVVKP